MYIISQPLIWLGSSPCVWGQVNLLTESPEKIRIIPMRVGTSQFSFRQLFFRQDHPHACGDKRPCVLLQFPLAGSSPCVWGQGKLDNGNVITAGIIPMRVGTSPYNQQPPQVAEDHPHACGDKLRFTPFLSLSIGSSPCVWGQDDKSVPEGTAEGIIPMRVGTSCLSVLYHRFFQDHPHACGDKVSVNSVNSFALGSSPCVWGQVQIGGIIIISDRIIPMRVGTRNWKS